MSLGFPPMDIFHFLGYTESQIQAMFRPLRDAVNYAQRRGVILVAASGNFDAPEVSLPAGYPGVIAVGATDPDDRRSSYSSFGGDLDLMAPGGDFGDLNHDHVQDAVFVLSIKPNRSEGSLAKPDSFGCFPFFGTSGAAPHVTGAVALLLAQGYNSQGSIEQTLKATAVRPPDRVTSRDLEYGAGLIQLDAALRVRRGGGPAAAAPKGVLAARLLSRNPARARHRFPSASSAPDTFGFASSTCAARSFGRSMTEIFPPAASSARGGTAAMMPALAQRPGSISSASRRPTESLRARSPSCARLSGVDSPVRHAGPAHRIALSRRRPA